MALSGVDAAVMKPAALVLNLAVAAIATVRFSRAGHFSWPLLWPFAVTSVPFAFVGGAIQLPAHWYKQAVGVVLFVAASRLFLEPRRHQDDTHHGQPPLPASDDERGRHRAFCWSHWHRRRHRPQSAPAVYRLVGDARKRRRLGSVHPAELGIRAGWQYRERWNDPTRCVAVDRHRRHWRLDRQ